jgi:hypothetical protein
VVLLNERQALSNAPFGDSESPFSQLALFSQLVLQFAEVDD